MTPTQLKRWQKRRGLTNEAAAAFVGVPLRTWEDWRAGRMRPRAAALALLKLKLT